MVNFVYLVGDRETGEALIVDPAYGIDDLLGILAADGMRCVGALGHPLPPRPRRRRACMGWGIEGITRLLEVADVPVHVQADEVPWVERSTGRRAPSDLVAHAGGDVVRVGRGPGHPGPHPGPHARAASASWSTASSSPATPSSSTGAAAPTSPAATRPPCTSR